MVIIDSVKFGEIRVNGKDYYSDVVVWWDGTVEMVAKTRQFGAAELARLLRKKPELIVLGIGLEGCAEVLEEAEQEMEDRKLMFFVENTANAIEVFNAFAKEGKKVVAFMHVTF
jgi:hypothetical protein